jgi:hypothetical protein
LELSSINSSIDYLDADEAKYQHNDAFLTPSPSDINMQETTSCNVYTITTVNDISDCVRQKNLQNNYSPTYSDDQSSQNSIVNMYSEREKLLWSMVFDSINFGGESSSTLLQHSNRIFSRIDSPIELSNSARARNELLAFKDTTECELATLYDSTFIEKRGEDALSIIYDSGLENANESFIQSNNDCLENNSSDKVSIENINTMREEIDESLGLDSEESDFETSKFETNFEIDGKYLKSLVNSKKYPKKVDDNESIKLSKEGSKLTVVKNKSKEEVKSIEEKIENEPQKDIRLFDDISYIKRLRLIINNKSPEHNKNQRQQLQGSLDSINLNEASINTTVESMTKKSKSFESIKRNAHMSYKTSEISYCDPVSTIKSDNTSQLLNTPTLDKQMNESYSTCCFIKNDCSPNCNSPEDEDSTECDICSSYNLQDSNDGLNCKNDEPTHSLSEPIEICEICGEPATITDESSITNENPIATINSRPMPLSLPKAKSTIEISRSSYKMSTFDDEHFEIDNCGLQDCKLRSSLDICNKPEPFYVNVTPRYHKIISQIDNRPSSKIKLDNEHLTQPEYYSRDSDLNKELKYTCPKDEVALSKSLPSSENEHLNRKGSSYAKINIAEQAEEKRRYSSVDNLQNRTFFKSGTEKLSKSRDNRFMTSADSIRPPRLARSKSLRRSADNVEKFDSCGDNLDCFEESVDADDNEVATDDNSRCARVNIKDSDMIKMILTKHGIKIISQKETVL